MKHHKTIATSRQVIDHYTCDWCGKDYKKPSDFTVSETTISHRTGVSYPECGDGEEITVDLCADCFQDRLVPLLEGQGCNVQVEDWDY